MILGDTERVLDNIDDDILLYFDGSKFKELAFSDKAL